jgi:hypothetical protein
MQYIRAVAPRTVVRWPIGQSDVESRQDVIRIAGHIKILLHLLVIHGIAHWLAAERPDQIVPSRAIDAARSTMIREEPVVLFATKVASGKIIVGALHHVVDTPINAVSDDANDRVSARKMHEELRVAVLPLIIHTYKYKCTNVPCEPYPFIAR